jgi:hypothetical protein
MGAQDDLVHGRDRLLLEVGDLDRLCWSLREVWIVKSDASLRERGNHSQPFYRAREAPPWSRDWNTNGRAES